MYRNSRSVGGCTWHIATGGYVKSLTLRYRIMLNFATTCAICNSSDLGVRLSSMPVNWKGRVAIRVLGRQSRGDFQFYRCEIHELVDLIPSPCVVFDLAPFSWPGEGRSLLWGTPPHRPSRTSPLQPFPGFPRSDVLAGGRRSLVRYYAHAEQVPLNLNTYREY